jgi:hypothetical protein
VAVTAGPDPAPDEADGLPVRPPVPPAWRRDSASRSSLRAVLLLWQVAQAG